MSWDWDRLKEQQQRNTPPPQFDEIFNKLRGLKIPGGSVIIILVVIVVTMAYSMVYQVDTNAVGVVQRFGKYVRTSQPGLNFKLPAGIEKVTIVRSKRVKKEEFGFETVVANQRQRFLNDAEQKNVSLMLTGDLNVAVVPWVVQYIIKDPYKYLFKVQDPNGLLRDMAEATMRLVVGDRSINEVISKREEIADQAMQLLQQELDEAETGINITTIEMKKTNVPDPVQPSFNEVNQATQEKEQLIYQANEDYNKAIPAARGEAERTIRAAEGYALDRINRAKGDAARFTALYEEYKKAKDVTRRRLYLEKMRDLLPKMGRKYIVDADQKNILPLLNLDNQNGNQP